MRRYVSWKEVYEWVKLRKEGYTYKEISERTGWGLSTVIKHMRVFELNPETLLSLYLASAFHDRCSLRVSLRKETKRMEELLQLEKERRGLSKDKLVFIGTANVASYYWCAMKSLLKSRENELEHFAAYLEDRIRYSSLLGREDKMPTNPNELLDIGNDITLSDIEGLLKKKEEGIIAYISAATAVDKSGNEVIVINPDLPPALRESKEEAAKSKGVRTADIEEFPKLRGDFLHTTRAEKYPTIRWNFSWENYVISGIPDGIADNFVYEFKTTRDNFLTYYIKPVAFVQADLYGYFFKRPRKRVQMYIVKEGKTETWEEDVKKGEALNLLERFKRVDEGETPVPPKKWKCKSCEFKEVCELRRKI